MMVNEPEDRFGTLPIAKVIQHALCQELSLRKSGDSPEKSQGAFWGNEK
jgi:hypothetical protein